MQLRRTFQYLLHVLYIRRIAKDGKSGLESLMDLLPVVYAAVLIMGAIRWLAGIPRRPVLWIKKGSVVKAFPVFQAMRIVRKHKWELVETEPIRYVGRWEALKILVRGDSKRAW